MLNTFNEVVWNNEKNVKNIIKQLKQVSSVLYFGNK